MRDPLTDRGDVTGGSMDVTERSSACSTGASQSSPRPIRFAVRRATPPTRPASCGRSPARTCWSPTRTGASLRPTPPRATPTAGPWSTSTPSLPTPADLSAGSCLDAATPSTLYPPGERSSTSTCASSQTGLIRPARSGSPTASTRVKRPRSPRYSGRRHLTRPRSTSRPRRSTPEGRLGMVSPRGPTREIHGGEPSPMGATVALPPRRTP